MLPCQNASANWRVKSASKPRKSRELTEFLAESEARDVEMVGGDEKSLDAT